MFSNISNDSLNVNRLGYFRISINPNNKPMRGIVKVKICDDFFNKWFECAARDENVSIEKVKGFYLDDGFLEMAERISGKETELFHCTYKVGEDDYFECIDDNFVIDRELFEII